MTTTTDAMGVEIRVGDVVRVISWGWSARLADTGKLVTVTGFTARGNVKHDDADVAYGEAIKPTCLAVQRRDGKPGHEANA